MGILQNDSKDIPNTISQKKKDLFLEYEPFMTSNPKTHLTFVTLHLAYLQCHHCIVLVLFTAYCLYILIRDSQSDDAT